MFLISHDAGGSHLDAEVAVHHIEAHQEAHNHHRLISKHEGPRLIELHEQVISSLQQQPEIVWELLLHQGQAQPGAGTAKGSAARGITNK